MRKLLMFSAAAIAFAATPALADMLATTTTGVNLRAGPSSREAVIGRIAAGETVTITGCVNAGTWCQVALADGEGFVSSRFLAGDFASAGDVMVTERTGSIQRPGSPGTTAGVVTGTAAGAVTGAVVGGPVGAAIGGAAGMIAGGTTGAILDPPYRVRSYVRSNRVEPIYLDNQYVVGSRLPRSVELRQIPDYQYRYVYVNDQQMLVDPGSRRIVYVVR